MSDYIESHAVRIDAGAFEGSVDELERLVGANASEGDLQRHIEAHPYILSQQFSHCHHVFPKVALGIQYETDFMCLDIPSFGREWVGIELEAPNKKVVTQKGRKTADLEHAIQQVRDWRAWVTDNLNYARQSRENNGLGLDGITPRFYGYVIIGRREDYNAKFNEIRRQLVRDELIAVRSWDGIIEWARKRARVLRGPRLAFGLLKKQQDQIELMKKRHDLSTLLLELNHAQELVAIHEDSVACNEKEYTHALQEWGASLPIELTEEIARLLQASAPANEILRALQGHLSEEISEGIFRDYIVLVVKSDDPEPKSAHNE